MTDFRALCAELLDELEDWIAYGDEADIADAYLLVDRARAALAEPEPVERPIWTEGICEDGAAILRDGVMQPIEDVIAALNAAALAEQPAEDRIAALQAELERERLRLAACGVVAMADTPDSAARARTMHKDYWSASLDDVIRQVDALMGCRAALAEQPAGPTDEELDEIYSTGHLPTQEELANDDGEKDLQFLFTSAYYEWLEENPEAEKEHRAKCLRAVFNAGRNFGHHAPQPIPVAERLRTMVKDAVACAIGTSTYDCTRVWEAWSVGTMDQDDFDPIVDSDLRLDEIADAAIDALLQHWGRPAPQPIPVSERLPGPEDCDAEGRCWFSSCLNADGRWNLEDRTSGLNARFYTHWLSAPALPLPEVGG